MLDVPSRFGSTSFQSKDVNGAQKSEFLFWVVKCEAFSLWAFTQGHNWLAVKINRNRSLYHTPTGFGLKPPPIWRCYECFTPRAWLNLTRNTCMKMPWRGRGLGIGIKEFSSDSNLASYMLRIVGTMYFISEIIALHYWGDIPDVHQSHSLSIPSSSRLMLQQDQDTHLSVED